MIFNKEKTYRTHVEIRAEALQLAVVNTFIDEKSFEAAVTAYKKMHGVKYENLPIAEIKKEEGK